MPGIPDVENVDLTADFESREYLAGLDVEDRIIVETGNGGRLIGEVDTDLLDRRSPDDERRLVRWLVADLPDLEHDIESRGSLTVREWNDTLTASYKYVIPEDEYDFHSTSAPIERIGVLNEDE